jgi:hypothetical protein
MNLDLLRELQSRGRSFYEMFPGAKASDAWQRQRNEREQREMATGRRPSQPEADDRPQQGPGTEDSNLGTRADARVREFLRQRLWRQRAQFTYSHTGPCSTRLRRLLGCTASSLRSGGYTSERATTSNGACSPPERARIVSAAIQPALVLLRIEISG